MSEHPLEEVISEKAFASVLTARAEMFHRLAVSLRALEEPWSREHFFQLISEADALEAFLDDHGARHNRAFHFLRELAASLRGLALAGFSLAHLERRFDSYGTVLSPTERERVSKCTCRSREFLQQALRRLLEAATREVLQQGIVVKPEPYPESRTGRGGPRQRLPRNMGQEDLHTDEQRVAETASRYLQVCGTFEELGARRIEDPDEREAWLQRFCTEERARVFEASVHNLQSVYDTWIKNTRLETADGRLPQLRGHVSAALHLLEAVTHLTHFVERHESGMRDEESEGRIEALVRREDVREITLNELLYWGVAIIRRGRNLAQDLLPSYTDVQEVVVSLPDDLYLHARPCALIMGIVKRYATPVEMEIDGRRCNAGSILDLMVAAGSNPDARRFVFRGDVNPLRDIRLLFQAGLGEQGIDALPAELSYLRGGS